MPVIALLVCFSFKMGIGSKNCLISVLKNKTTITKEINSIGTKKNHILK